MCPVQTVTYVSGRSSFKSGEAVAFPGKVFPVANIPIRVPEHFLSRDGAIDAIDAALKRGAGPVAITALHGLRGVGKTTSPPPMASAGQPECRTAPRIRAQISRQPI
jgi:hypothetical protein